MVTMPHRGRLNLMTNLMSYPAEAIFHKLLGNSELPENLKGSADVLSHLSLQNKVTIAGNENGLVTLLPNPSHLEAVNSVGLGATYAYKKYKIPNEKCLSVQFHGDAAFTGQGVVSECLQLSKLPNFSVGGTIHIICNNQLGFTTPADYGRSSKYASDPAKAISAPILHVNADEPEEVAKISCIAVEYQRKFKKDVVIDLIGWRKRGHNELDEPMFTQPQMYKSINERSSTAQKYAKLVIQEEMKNIEEKSFKDLDAAVIKAKDYKPQLIGIQKDWKLEEQETGVPKDLLIEAGIRSVSIPDDFNVHYRLQNHHIDSRLTQIKGGKVDWATAEAMAIGSLISDGFNVRLSGQDVARGTFSHRHLKFYDQIDGKEICPFENWKSEGKLELAPSNLSEFGVLGFEYGLSIVSGNKVLPIWEAQFGDFFNGAQIIFDTFLKRSYVKPLIIIGPKTLLRSPQAVSDMKEMEIGTRFKPILINQIGKSHKKLIFVSGKFYYEIAKVVKNGTLVRIEELNPFPFEEVREKVKGEFNEIIWCQEEPRNMGAFSFVHPKLVEVFGKPVKYVGRKSAAAPATGISSRHKLEYSEILNKLG
jgi:probable 2-oxoglutarate dehydrogenase E1 component DHKTD1